MLGACQNHDLDEGESNEETLQVSIALTTTLSTRSGSTYVDADRFAYNARIGVFAYHTEQTTFGEGNGHLPNFMYNQMVYNYFGTWTYSPIKYWPNRLNDKVTFCAYYPHNGLGIDFDCSTGGLPRYSFQVQEYSKDEVDFMLSDVKKDEMHRTPEYTTPIDYKVGLTFHHVLAKIVVKVLNEEEEELPFTATLSGLYDHAVCRINAADNEITWSDLGKSTPAVVFTTEGAKTPTEHIFLMIPQSLDGEGIDPCLHLSYNYHGGFYDVGDIHLNNMDGVTEWLPNRTYTYIYHATHTGTDLSVSVNPWYQTGMVFNYN